MVTRSYIPDAGDLVWLNFSPQAGREQAGHRPGLILSPAAYNSKSGLALVCPITSQVKGYPFEVAVSTSGINGVVLVDHIRSLDWRSRSARKAGRASAALLNEVRALLFALLGAE